MIVSASISVSACLYHAGGKREGAGSDQGVLETAGEPPGGYVINSGRRAFGEFGLRKRSPAARPLFRVAGPLGPNHRLGDPQ